MRRFAPYTATRHEISYLTEMPYLNPQDCRSVSSRIRVLRTAGNGAVRLIADIQQRKENDTIRPPAAIRPLDANDGITAFSDIPAPTVFIDHQGDPASPNSSKNRLCRFLSTSDSLTNGAIAA